MMQASLPELLAVICFSAALLHSLNANAVAKLAVRFRTREVAHHFLHHLSEIEVIFGFWALLYLIALFFILGIHQTIDWVNERNFSESLFMVAVMVAASTAPILKTAGQGINQIAKLLPLSKTSARYLTVLILGPLFGSFITEPAAMTVSALLLHQEILPQKTSNRLLYSTLAILFVNVSIGGLLTAFAAPPVLMVARHWNWTTPFMFQTFGLKAMGAVILNALLAYSLNQKELKESFEVARFEKATPAPISILNFIFLILIVLTAHYPVLLIAIMLLWLDYISLTRKHQGLINSKSALFVGFFLAGLTVLTAEQGFWLKPILAKLESFTLYLSAGALTAVTDNAALTSLAAQVPDLSPETKYAILGGAVVGGGLTLIANAPNPAGYSILKERFGTEGLKPGTLLAWALIPTLIAGAALWI